MCIATFAGVFAANNRYTYCGNKNFLNALSRGSTHTGVLGVVISLLITKIFIIMEKEVFVIFENSNYNFSYLASSGFNSSDLIKSHLNQIHFVDNKKATAKCIECIVK